MPGLTTGWTPDDHSDEDYTLDTGKIKTLIKQVQVSRGLINFLDVLNEKEKLQPDTKNSIASLKTEIEGVLDSYISNIDLVSANILDKVPPADTRGNTIAIAPLLAEEIFQLVFKEWKNKYNLTDQKDDQVKASLQAVFSQLAPIRQYFEIDDQELKDFIHLVDKTTLKIDSERNRQIENLQNLLSPITESGEVAQLVTTVVQALPEKFQKLGSEFPGFLATFKTELYNKLTGRSKEDYARKALGLFNLQQAAQQIIQSFYDKKGGQALPEEALLENAVTRGALLKSSFLNVEKDNTSYPLCIQIPLSQNLGRQLKTTELSSVPSKRSNPWHTYLFKSNNAEADQTQSSHCLYVLPEAVDLSYWCSPVKDQGPINACTVNAVASLVEYFEKRSSNKDYRASRRFLYKVTRKIAVDTNNHYLDDISEDELKGFAKSPEEDTLDRLKKLIGEVKLSHQPVSISVIQELVKSEKRDEFKRKLFDIGASIRHTLKALQLFGIPPERYWAYHTDYPNIDEEPIPFCYSFAQNYQALKYFRLDLPGKRDRELNLSEEQQQKRTLTQIRTVLAAGFPCIFGFPIEFITSKEDLSKQIPNPGQVDRNTGEIRFLGDEDEWLQRIKESLNQRKNTSVLGHAVLAVGYDDNHSIPHSKGKNKGAFLIQNSWGNDWGTKGYGWLPYDYVQHKLATNWWSLMNLEWVETGEFGLSDNLGPPPTINRP